MEFDSLGLLNKTSSNGLTNTSSIPAEKPKTDDTENTSNIEKQTAQNRTENLYAAKSDADSESEPDAAALEKAVAKANKKLLSFGREFSFSVHDKTNKVMIKVLDSSSKEVLREIPPEKALDALAKMWEMAGILIDEKG